MKAFARHRTPKTVDDRPTGAGNDPIEAPVDPSDDFIERLGDLDRFIGGPAVPPVTWPTTPPSRNLFTRPDDNPAAPAPAPRPTAQPAERPATSARHAAHDTSEADDFIERLSDLDRFIGGGTVAEPPAPAAPTTHDDAEANDFLERLGDLDRFIGGPPTAPRQG